jgi:hypothetical protein
MSARTPPSRPIRVPQGLVQALLVLLVASPAAAASNPPQIKPMRIGPSPEATAVRVELPPEGGAARNGDGSDDGMAGSGWAPLKTLPALLLAWELV